MSKAVFWLHTNLFVKTKKHMEMGNEQLSLYIQENCHDIIRLKFEDLRSIMSRHCDKNAETPEAFLLKWEIFKSRLSWPNEIFDNLEKIIRVLKTSPDIVIDEQFLNDLDAIENGLSYQTRFSVSALKNQIVTPSLKNNFADNRIDIFIRFAMIPYFKKNAGKFNPYLMWLRNPDNLLKVSDNKVEKLQYFPATKAAVASIVSAYCFTHENDSDGVIEFVEDEFFKMMKDLFIKLYNISNQHEWKPKEESDKEIIESIKKTYWPQIFPDPSFYSLTYTLGVSIDELNILVDDAAEDALMAYRSYCRFCEKEKPPSWIDCVTHSGFCMEMLYFLYSRLSKQDSEYLQDIAKRIRDNGYNMYKTFINENATIDPTVFINENCYIENAEIRERVYLTNSKISDGVIIGEDTVFDAKNINVEKDAYVKAGTVLKGDFSVDIFYKIPWEAYFL